MSIRKFAVTAALLIGVIGFTGKANAQIVLSGGISSVPVYSGYYGGGYYSPYSYGSGISIGFGSPLYSSYGYGYGSPYYGGYRSLYSPYYGGGYYGGYRSYYGGGYGGYRGGYYGGGHRHGRW